MVPIELSVLGNLACRLLVKFLVRVARVKVLSVSRERTVFTVSMRAAKTMKVDDVP